MSQASQSGVAGAFMPWGAMQRLLSVQVLGAEEVVGREVALELLRAAHPLAGLQLFGDQARVVGWQGHRVQVHALGGPMAVADLAFVCTSAERGATLVPQLLAAGTRVIDLSGATKADLRVPLVMGSPRGEEFGAFTQHVALPQRSAVGLGRALDALEARAGLAQVEAFACVAAASEGSRGLLALREEWNARVAAAAQGGQQEVKVPEGGEHRRLGNLQPALGDRPGATPRDFEAELVSDLRRLVRRPDLMLGLTALESPLERCDAVSIRARLRGPLDPSEAEALFSELPGVRVHLGGVEPLPEACAGSDQIHVGRIRTGSDAAGSLCFFLVADQLRAGAAAVALRVGAHLLAGGP